MEVREIEKIIAKAQNRLTMHQCEELAKDDGFDKMEFYLCGPKGKIKCRWLDAYFGMFIPEGGDGFMMAREFYYNPEVWCEIIATEEANNVNL